MEQTTALLSHEAPQAGKRGGRDERFYDREFGAKGKRMLEETKVLGSQAGNTGVEIVHGAKAEEEVEKARASSRIGTAQGRREGEEAPSIYDLF